MKVLVINAGSSSLKYQLLDTGSQEVLAKGLCERIGIDGKFTYKAPGKETIEGYLIPEVSFVTGDANPDQKSSTPDLDLPRVKLTIPGQSGEYPKIIQVEEEYGIRSGSGNTTTEKLLGAPPAAPETKKMDAYRGEIDEWNPFKEGPGEGKKPSPQHDPNYFTISLEAAARSSTFAAAAALFSALAMM